MTNQTGEIITPKTPGELLHLAGQAANQAAGAAVFLDYRGRKAANTLKRQGVDLALFAQFLAGAGVPVGDLANKPEAWRGVTWGLVAAFVAWQLQNSYAIGSINARLSTIKVYSKLAALAGAIEPGELALIRSVSGYAHKEQKNIDEKRQAVGLEIRKGTGNTGKPIVMTRKGELSKGTRAGTKKATAVSLTIDQARQLKDQPNTPQGRRDRLALFLFMDLGLRVGELAGLTVDNFNLSEKTLNFYRQKVDKYQTMTLKNVVLSAVRAWFENGDAPAIGSLWRSSRKSKTGKLQESGWSVRAINARVTDLGAEIGIVGLSPHDLRHFWATQAARNNTPMDRLQDAGGWSSLAMPARYIEAAKIANEGVNLGEE